MPTLPPIVIVEGDGRREEVVPDVLAIVEAQLIRRGHLLGDLGVPGGRNYLQSVVLMPLWCSYYLPPTIMRMEDTLYDVVMMFIGGKYTTGVIGDFTLGRTLDIAIWSIGSECESDLGNGRLRPNPLANNDGEVFFGEMHIVPFTLLGIVFVHKYLFSWEVPIGFLLYFREQWFVSLFDLQ